MDNIVGFVGEISPEEHPFHPTAKGVLPGKSRNRSLTMIAEYLMKWMRSNVSTNVPGLYKQKALTKPYN